jgi:hypothetical protein
VKGRAVVGRTIGLGRLSEGVEEEEQERLIIKALIITRLNDYYLTCPVRN